jgi:hypothetical protein
MLSLVTFGARSNIGPWRHFACAQQSGRFQVKAGVKRQAGPAGSVENDPQQTLETLSGVWTKIGSSVDDHEEFAVTCKAIGTF